MIITIWFSIIVNLSWLLPTKRKKNHESNGVSVLAIVVADDMNFFWYSPQNRILEFQIFQLIHKTPTLSWVRVFQYILYSNVIEQQQHNGPLNVNSKSSSGSTHSLYVIHLLFTRIVCVCVCLLVFVAVRFVVIHSTHHFQPSPKRKELLSDKKICIKCSLPIQTICVHCALCVQWKRTSKSNVL